MYRKQIIWLCMAVIGLWLHAAAVGQTVTCTVFVVDTQAKPVPDAEVVVYEDRTNPLMEEEEPAVLCEPQKTGPDGKVTLQFNFKRLRVMVIARKAGYAFGWDLLHYPRVAPHVSIILDRPVVFAGRVLDDQGRPVAGASVQAQPKTCKLDRLEQWPVIGPAEWMTVRTDTKGRFEFNCFGEDVSTDFIVTPPESKTAFKFTPYYLSSCGYEAGENICLTLPKRTVVEGQVVDENDQAVGDITVLIRPDHRERNFRINYVPLLTKTDESGRFYFEDIPSGSHFLTTLNTDLSKPWVVRPMLVNTTDGRDLRFRLETGGIMEVTMLDEVAQKPIENMYLIFSKAPGEPNEFWFSRSVGTNAEGKAKVMLPAGQCNVRYWDDRPYERRELKLPVVEKDKSQAITFTLVRHKPITGRVNNPDGTPAQCTVKMTWGQTARTNAGGAFKCTYNELREDMCLIARDVENNTAAVSLAGDPDEPAVLTLQPACKLKGKVVDPNGNPIPAARIEVNFDGPGYLSGCCPEILTDKNGRFEVKAIPSDLPDDFAFRISTTTMNHGSKTYQRLKIQKETDEFIELEPIQMSPVNQTVDGFVVKADGTPAAGLPIFLQGTGQYHQSTVTDENGRFWLRRICEGQIRLQAGISSVESERGFVTADGGDTDVKIVLGQRLVHEPQTSIAEKSLPALDAFDVEASEQQLRNKSILVCFWDFSQRPSRHMVGQLAEMKENFAEKAVQVVLIHAAPMDENVKNWLAEKELPVHAGSITKDADQIRSKWGVQSLPWLILTDAEHNVVAEGFSVGELADKLKNE